jgi:hyperosmotically inducible periplasmic protein
MARTLACFVAIVTLGLSNVSGQEGVLSRTGRALDNAGRDIRNAVDNGIAQGQIAAEDRDVLNRVVRRVEWDKHLVGSTIQFEVRPGRTIVLRGSVPTAVHKQRAAELVSSTTGVVTVIDELGVVKDVKVINTNPAPTVVVPSTPVITETKVIVKP